MKTLMDAMELKAVLLFMCIVTAVFVLVSMILSKSLMGMYKRFDIVQNDICMLREDLKALKRPSFLSNPHSPLDTASITPIIITHSPSTYLDNTFQEQFYTPVSSFPCSS